MTSSVLIPICKHAAQSLSIPLHSVAGTMLGMGMGDRIKEARVGAKLSVQDLANKVRCSRSAVYQWESGDTKGLRPENLFAVADATGYSARWIGTGNGTKRELKALDHDGTLDLSFLTTTIEAVEKYLDDNDLTLDADAKSKLITLLYETHKGKVEAPTVARYLRLVA